MQPVKDTPQTREEQIEALEAAVRVSTKLNWQLMEIIDSSNCISWQLLLPLAGERIKVSATSDMQKPDEINNVYFDCQPRLLMDVLRLVSAA